ncbi:MAG: hypothetical protein AWU54_795 [Candidatus Frackibacter sp. T328-2]|nr:MAG: hypothetical protein AWU54_795 [Candidatus Frackibacter sp. T328-2]
MEFLKDITEPFIELLEKILGSNFADKLFNTNLFDFLSSFSITEIIIALIIAFFISKIIQNVIFQIISIASLVLTFLVFKYLLVSGTLNNIIGELSRYI